MIEYPWYELIEESCEITQGDILKNCPVPILKDIPSGDIYEENDSIKTEIEYIDGIVLTQACDLANNKVDNIILCSITGLDNFKNENLNNGKKIKEIQHDIDGIIKGQQNALHIINHYVTEEFKDDYYIINFKDVFSIPLSLAKSIAQKNGKRLRLCPPYREHLSQAFARYFMRVGLPIDLDIKM